MDHNFRDPQWRNLANDRLFALTARMTTGPRSERGCSKEALIADLLGSSSTRRLRPSFSRLPNLTGVGLWRAILNDGYARAPSDRDQPATAAPFGCAARLCDVGCFLGPS